MKPWQVGSAIVVGVVLNGLISASPSQRSSREARASLRDLFAQRLTQEMDQRKWTLATLLREARPHLPEGFKLSHSHLWHYLRGKALPHQEVRQALSKALGADLEAAPAGATPETPLQGRVPDAQTSAAHDGPSGESSKLLVEDIGGGFARLRFDQELPWPVVIRILDTIKGSADEA